MLQKLILITILTLNIASCNMKSQEIEYTKFKELHEHEGSENYELVEIVPNKARIVNPNDNLSDKPVIYADSITNKMYIETFALKDDAPEDLSMSRTIDTFGNTIAKKQLFAKVLKDGTIWESVYYFNWFINGDITKHYYVDPFSNIQIEDPYEFIVKEKDHDKWFEKFKEYYVKASYIHIDMSFYYFKIDHKWYLIKISGMSDKLNIDIKQEYPAKEDQDVRMVELKNLAPIFYYDTPEKLDTHLIKKIDYESTYFKEVDKGLNQYNFSAGWWYLEIYMPLGDTIKLKRYSNYEDPELMLYKIPDAYGGREDVLFIVQNPEEIFTSQVGGMYAIRPRDPEQPQRRYKSIVYNKNESGERVIDLEQSEETEAYMVWIKKKK